MGPASEGTPKGMRIPIRFKMLFVIAAVLLVAIGTYLYLATALFRADKIAYIYDLNASLVGTLSEQTRSSLSVLVKEAALFAREVTRPGVDDERRALLEQELFTREPNILRVELLSGVGPGGTFTGRSVALHTDALEGLNLLADDLDFARREHPLPADAIVGQPDYVYVHNSSLKPDKAILTVAFAHAGGTLVVVDFSHQRLLRIFGRSDLHETFLVDGTGTILAHPNAEKVTNAEDHSADPLVRAALTADVAQGVTEFVDPQTGVAYLGGYAQVGLGRLLVLTQIPKARALRASQELIERSIAFAVVILLAAFLVSIFFSRYLAGPIRQLRAATEVIGGGRFDVDVEVRSRDEIGDLADAFNRMAHALKEAQAQLIQSEKMAAFGQLGAGITHEIKNPMTGIVGFAQLAQGKVNEPEKTLELLQLIEQEGLRCRDILVNFLRFARASEGEQELVAVNQLIAEAERMVKHQLNMNRVKIVVTPEASDPKVRGNEVELQQVLMNLAINAQQAMTDGGQVEFSVSREPGEKGEEVVIRVADTGPGIPEEIRRKVFEPFFTTKEKGDGTGLGLSVSFGIVQSHGGRLEVESTLGEGATFIIRLPAAEAEAQASAVSQSA